MTSAESTPATHNQPEYSVSEIAGAVKRTVEDNFGHVRVRGEVSGFKRAASGHLYMDLKDEKAVLNGVCWKGQAAKLAIQPQDGLEVICTGRMTTYPGRSNYQLVIERMELAGEGALMALLEKLKKQLAAEGLFAPERKQLLPYLPRTIGVVTSPTGAVIRDILHRISERFPAHVMVWPVIVQGKGAEAKIAAAIDGFNAFDGIDTPPKPDILIVARGGGSMEDLWCFNEEVVVRAAANSDIPLISAIGHETDTTLIDFASDKRAPTPTAAAEMAVPVLSDLRYTLNDAENRLQRSAVRALEQRQQQLESLARGLVNPRTMLEGKAQRADEWSERLQLAWQGRIQREQERLGQCEQRLSPSRLLQQCGQLQEKLAAFQERASVVLPLYLQRKADSLQALARGMATSAQLQQKIATYSEKLALAYEASTRTISARITQHQANLDALARMSEAMSHQNILKRGFAYVTNDEGKLVSSSKKGEASMQLHFHDGEMQVFTQMQAPKKKAPKKQLVSEQGSLL